MITPQLRQEELNSLQLQLENTMKSLQLIRERQSQYVMEIDIPLQLFAEESRLTDKKARLDKEIRELESFQPRKPKSKARAVTLTLEGDIRDYNTEKGQNILIALSQILNISKDEIRIQRVVEGSIRLTLIMFSTAVRQLQDRYQRDRQALWRSKDLPYLYDIEVYRWNINLARIYHRARGSISELETIRAYALSLNAILSNAGVFDLFNLFNVRVSELNREFIDGFIPDMTNILDNTYESLYDIKLADTVRRDIDHIRHLVHVLAHYLHLIRTALLAFNVSMKSVATLDTTCAFAQALDTALSQTRAHILSILDTIVTAQNNATNLVERAVSTPLDRLTQTE